MGERVSEQDIHTEDRNRGECVFVVSLWVGGEEAGESEPHQTPKRDRQSISQSNVS